MSVLENENTEIVKFLLKNGADVNAEMEYHGVYEGRNGYSKYE